MTNPDMDGAQLTKLIVQSYIADDQRIADPAARADFLHGGSPLGGLFGSNPTSPEQLIAQMEKNITISSVDLEKLPALMQSMNDFAYALQDDDQKLIAEAHTYAQSYTSIFGREVPPAYIDLGHFAVLLANNTSNARVKQAAAQLVSSLQSTIVAERHGSGKKGSTGLAIYFPNSTLYSSPLTGPQSYTAIASRFASDSLWDDFLAYHYIDISFEPQTREPNFPNTSSVRAPGQGNITFSEITASSNVASPNQPVRLSVDISGENVGYIYLFVGYLDSATNSVAVLDTDFLESPDTRELNGVYYPVWSDDFTLSFEWAPVVFAINNGQDYPTALFAPQSYGATFEEATYTVDGLYTFAESGDSVNASLYFQNGNLVQVFGITGSSDTGAPREITPTPGDTFTLLEKWIESPSGTPRIVYQNGATLTFGAQPFQWEQLFAAAGEYVVGFIIEDLDGHQFPVYTPITVQ